jgi:heterodisulfide reductase subunit A
MDGNLERLQDMLRMNLSESVSGNGAGDRYGDVMVVGGGISGVQASLDMASAGFKVFLVDKAPAIGGHMAQLDKTFPTNECSI